MPCIRVNMKRTNFTRLTSDLYSYVVAGMCSQHEHTSQY